MKLYEKGKVISIGNTYLIFETNNIGKIIYVSDPKLFTKSENQLKLYIYHHTSEYSNTLYGFKNFKERILFEDLISVNGIGPKTAITILKLGSNEIINMIASSNQEGLSSIPYVGSKTANQIIFELSAKYQKMKSPSGMISPIEVKPHLKTLGFNVKQINVAMESLKPDKTIEMMIEKAIRLISSAKSA